MQSTNELCNEIENDLKLLDQIILELGKNVVEAATIEERDRKLYEDFLEKERQRKSETWFFSFDHNAPEVRAYKGDYFSMTYIPESNGLTNYMPCYTNTGSQAKLLEVNNKLRTTELDHNLFKTNFERGKKYSDVEYLKTVNRNIKKYNDDKY